MSSTRIFIVLIAFALGYRPATVASATGAVSVASASQAEPAKKTEPAKVAGKWNCVLELESITGHPVLTFTQDGEKLSGTYQGRYGESPLAGTIKDNKIEFAVTINAEGTQSQGVFAGTVDGDSMKGRVAFEGGGEGTWSAERVKQ
jgi:hypothetical protein